MPPTVRQVAPGRLQIREGGGCLSLFGLPFFGAGVMMILVAAGIVPLAGDTPPAAYAVLAVMGATFTAVGGWLVFGRGWTTLDATSRTVIQEWGLLVPLRTWTCHAEDVTAVVVGFEAGDSDSADQFPVTLRRRSGPDIRLCRVGSYAEARACAAAAAEHLHLEIEDASSGQPVRLSAREAGLSLQDRLRLDRSLEGASPRPPEGRSEVEPTGSGVRIVIPAPRSHPLALLALLLPAAVPLFVLRPLLRFFRETNTPEVVGWAFLAFILVAFTVLPATMALNAWLRSRRGRTIVTASTEEIVVQERGPWRTTPVAQIPGRDVLEVDAGPGRAVSARTGLAAGRRAPEPGERLAEEGSGPRRDRLAYAISQYAGGGGVTIKWRGGMTTFGRGLTDDESLHLRDVVRRALTGGRADG